MLKSKSELMDLSSYSCIYLYIQLRHYHACMAGLPQQYHTNYCDRYKNKYM